METVKDRLLRFLRAEGISNSEFARRMGVSVAYIGAMRKSMPEEKVARMTEEFPRINRNWLLYGEGEMILTDDSDASSQKKQQSLDEYMVPILPVKAFAGSLQDWSEGVRREDCELVYSPFPGAEMAINVTGDSMEPQIPNGSTIFVKKIDGSLFIPWGNPMVIDTENGVLIKVVHPSLEGDDYIEARSYNPAYPPIQIPKSGIFGLYRVLATMSTNPTF